MASPKLPKRLEKEPLIDAVFEIRFTSEVPASNLLPGILFSQLKGEKIIGALPITQIPKPVRDADPNLQFAPVNRLEWNRFVVNIGDRSISIGCKLPYPGWSAFRSAICEVGSLLAKSDIVKAVERYSIRYVDLIPSAIIDKKALPVDLELRLAGHILSNEHFQVLMEISEGEFVNAVRVISSAIAKLPTGDSQEGMIVDIDTIANTQGDAIDVFLDRFSEKLDAIHVINKKMFFDALTNEIIETLGPVYD